MTTVRTEASVPALAAVTMARTPGAAFATARSIDAMRPLAIADPTMKP